jgi:hypothetical protein
MYRAAYVLLCAALVLPAPVGGQVPQTVPSAVGSTLDRRYPGWRIAAVSADVLRWAGKELGPTPNVISGDFDGDGRR